MLPARYFLLTFKSSAFMHSRRKINRESHIAVGTHIPSNALDFSVNYVPKRHAFPTKPRTFPSQSLLINRRHRMKPRQQNYTFRRTRQHMCHRPQRHMQASFRSKRVY